ncbi:MAG TPA: ATP-dependent zinc metalloprotease FtsH [Gaiellaceae bacterium]|nr:ATP-dependent zinc metalloprotease FtsH [Gaiellaceae bacterium]
MKRVNPLIWILLALLAVPLITYAIGGTSRSPTQAQQQQNQQQQGKSQTDGSDESASPTISSLIQRAKTNPSSIELADFDPNTRQVTMTLKNGHTLQAYYASDTAQGNFQSLLEKENVPFAAKATDTGGGSWWGTALAWLLPLVLIGALLFWLSRRSQGGAGGAQGLMGVGKAKARRVQPGKPQITFKDVAGLEEAVEELDEIREFLVHPRKFRAVGARIPKGVLLYGPPGTGKTLLARAVAGEAGVPFFSISASEFVEVFVGVGASRVRDLFKQAKETAPAIIFVDEIDAVGRHRGAGMGGGHDEREQTLNQMLVEMDGFEPNDNVIVIAATNRSDVLDPALLRPGRFDRQIVVDLPDRTGRREILEVHAKGKPFADDVDLDAIAAGTPGFSGADLSNLVNEAALLTARRGLPTIGTSEIEEGVMRVIAGPQKKGRILSEEERRITAYHEMGHALVGHFLPNCDPVHKISIVSRGQSLGVTVSLPAEERYLTTRGALLDRLAMTLGGHAAEQLVFHEVTTGASDDLRKATELAQRMVMRFGMSRKLGLRVLGDDGSQPFAGRQFGNSQPLVSDELARGADEEIRGLLDHGDEIARTILDVHRETLGRLSELLLRYETIEREDFERLVAGGDMPEPAAEAQPEPERRPAAEPEPSSKPATASPLDGG